MPESEETNDNNKNVEEFSSIIEKWKKENAESSYDPIPMLSHCSELVEAETIEFQKSDPDPFDDRHPKSIIPGCALGNMLTILPKEDDFTGVIINRYINQRSSTSNISKVTIAATRLLLAVMPGVDAHILNSPENNIVDLLYDWAGQAQEPLNIYATGILVHVLQDQDTSIKYTKSNTKLIPILLKQIKSMIFPLRKEYKRKRKSSHADAIVKKCAKSDVVATIHDVSMPSVSDLCDNDISNSSWSEQMPFLVGGIYDLSPPLSDTVKQRFILDFLKSVGEYQDYLPIFIENKVLDIIKYFMTSNKPDGLLTFKALHFLGNLLCHNKIATEFINKYNGIDLLLSVQRPSLSSTGVSMCLYYLSYNVEAMESVCQLSKSKHQLVKYAVWLLECSHESGRCHAALFFTFSFAFRVILDLFDHFGGLRCLLNMISMSTAILNAESDYTQSSRQTIKVVCQTLRKYCEAHLVLKTISLQSGANFMKWHAINSLPSHKAMECTQEQIQDCLDFMRDFVFHRTTAVFPWPAIDIFLKHEGVKLMLQTISIALKWRGDMTVRLETLKSALFVLSIISLSNKVQMLLLKKVETPETEETVKNTGMNLLLDIADDQYSTTNPETVIQKLSLSVIVSCVYMPQKVTDCRVMLEENEACKRKMWKSIKENDGIQILLHLLMNKRSEATDEICILACKSLFGLAHLDSVKQILTKLHMFNSGQLQSLMRESVVQGKQKEHAVFCKCVEALIQKVTGKPASFEHDNYTYKKSVIASQTQIRFDNKELLALVHSHLLWSGCTATANLLKKEAGLSSKVLASMFQVQSKRVSPPPSVHDNAHGEVTTPVQNRISFSRGSHAQGLTPMVNNSVPAVPTTPATPTSSSYKKLLKNRLRNHVSSRFKLSNNGKVLIKPSKLNKEPTKSLPSLNTIIEDHFKSQHVSCSNPVVTVPEFSLFTKHFCPEKKRGIRAPLNIAHRSVCKQYTAPYGGVSGNSYDKQYVFSRFKPKYTVSVPDDRRINYTCAAFSANNDQLLIGDHKGGVTVHSLNSQNDNIIAGVGSGEIVSMEPSMHSDTVIVIYENLWNYHCSLYSANQFELKCSYGDASSAEFSKVMQDKVIGTKGHTALVYDAITGTLNYSLKKPELGCNYQWNRATFSWDDNLVLSDGLLWDVRTSHVDPIHRFDKFSDLGESLFHTSGMEILINSHVWDLRNYHLLHTVPALEQRRTCFNKKGTIIYGVKCDDSDDQKSSTWSGSNISTFDARDYKHLTTYEVKHDIVGFASDGRDCLLALIEKSGYDDSRSYESAISNCRVYDIGMQKGEDFEEDEESIIESDSDNDDDDNSSGSFSSIEIIDDGSDGSDSGQSLNSARFLSSNSGSRDDWENELDDSDWDTLSDDI